MMAAKKNRAVICVIVMVTLGMAAWAAPAPPPPAPPGTAGDARAFTETALGQQLYKQGKWKEASDVLERAVRDNARNEHAWYVLGLAYKEQMRWPDAERALQQVVSLNQRDYNAWVQLSDCALSQGRYDQARLYVQKIFTFDQRSFYAYYALGVIDYKQARIGEAITNFERSKGLYGDFPSTWYNLAVCAYNQHVPQTALARIRKAVLLEPKRPLYLFLQGWYSMMSNDPGSGFLAFRHLFEEDKKGTSYTDTARAFLSMKAGNLVEARKFLDEALKKDPEMAKALVLKALLLVRDNKKDEAIAALQDALEVDSLDYDARDILTHLGVTPAAPHPARLPGQKPVETATPPAPLPSGMPGAAPIGEPGKTPVEEPSGSPSGAPSGTPATSPSGAPTASPSAAPLPPPGVPH